MMLAIRHALPMIEIAARECRWPVNNPAQGEGHLFCAAPTAGLNPYCITHCRLAYRPKASITISNAA